MANRVVTLDVDDTTVRLLETRGRKVTKWASASLKREQVGSEAGSDRLELGTTVKQLMKSSGINAGTVITSLSGVYSVSRILGVPKPTRGLATEESVLQAAKEIMPVSEDKQYFSWQTIDASEDEQRVLFVSVPREEVDDKMQSLRAVGINPKILELRAMALGRVVDRTHALVLNVGHSGFDIVMVVNGVPEIMRTIPWQQGDLTMEDYASYLAVTLELTVDFYNSYYADNPVESNTPLFVVGQMSEEPVLMEKLQDRLTYPVEPLSPPIEYPENLPISQYAVNIGLALRSAVSSKSGEQSGQLPLNINLLPDVYRPWRLSKRHVYSFGLIIAAIALLFPVIQLTNDAVNSTSDMKMRVEALNHELQRRQLEIKNRAPMQRAVKEYNTIMNVGGNYTEDLEVINLEAEKLNIHLDTVFHEGSSIDITCQADSYITFREYLLALEQSGRFSTPDPPAEGYPYTKAGTITLEPVTME